CRGQRLHVVTGAKAAVTAFHLDRIGVGLRGSRLPWRQAVTVGLLALLLSGAYLVDRLLQALLAFAGSSLASRHLLGRAGQPLMALLLGVFGVLLGVLEVSLQGGQAVEAFLGGVGGGLAAVEGKLRQGDQAVLPQGGNVLDEDGLQGTAVVGIKISQ